MPIDPLALFVSIPTVLLTVTFVIVVRRSAEGHPDSFTVEEIDESFQIYTGTAWFLTLAVVVLFTAAGFQIATKFFDIGPVSAVIGRFGEWGYSTTFRQFIGASEVISALLLLFPRTAIWAAGYLSIIMAGSIYTHIAYGTYALAAIPLVLLLVLVFLAYERYLWSHLERPPALGPSPPMEPES